jgi:hypothetical protein
LSINAVEAMPQSAEAIVGMERKSVRRWQARGDGEQHIAQHGGVRRAEVIVEARLRGRPETARLGKPCVAVRGECHLFAATVRCAGVQCNQPVAREGPQVVPHG